METDWDISSYDNCCLICGSSAVDGSTDGDENDVQIAETFLNCVDLTENSNDLRENIDGIEFCLRCKLKLEELDYVRSQIDRLLLRLKQLRMSIVADAVLQSSVKLENSSARWIRRLIRKKFHPRVCLKKCDSEKQTIPREQPRKSCSVARKRPTAHSLRVSVEPKEIQQTESTEYKSTTDEFDASSLLPIKFEQFESEEMEDYEMRDPLELDATEVTENSSTSLMLKHEGADIEANGPPGSTSKRPTFPATNFPTVTVTPLYKLLPSTVDSQMAANDYQVESNDCPVLLKDDDRSSGGPLRADEPPQLQLVGVDGNSYRIGEFLVERLGDSYKCSTCGKTFSGMSSAFSVKRHIKSTHEGRPNNSESSTFEAALVREINPQDFLYRDSIPFTSDENEGSFACGHCGVKFVSEAPRLGMSGKERIMMHMEYVHTSVKRVAAEEETTRETAVETFEFGGVRVSVIEDKHTCGTCSKVFEGKLGRPNVIVHIRNCHLKPPRFVWKSVTEVKPGKYLYQNTLPFRYVGGFLECGLCPRMFLAEKRPGLPDISMVLHLKQDHSDMVNVSVVDPGEGEEPKEGMIGPVQSQGSVRINCPTNVCEEKCYSKVVVGKHGSYKVTTHTRRCRLKLEQPTFRMNSATEVKSGEQPTFTLNSATEVKPGEYLYWEKFPVTYKGGKFHCGLCPRFFVTYRSRAAAEKRLISHLKAEHSDERKKLTDGVNTPVEAAGTVQNLPAANAVISEP